MIYLKIMMMHLKYILTGREVGFWDWGGQKKFPRRGFFPLRILEFFFRWGFVPKKILEYFSRRGFSPIDPQISEEFEPQNNSGALFRNKGFLVNLKTKRNASKFAMFMEKENPYSFFRFSFRATFIFPLWMPWSMLT